MSRRRWAFALGVSVFLAAIAVGALWYALADQRPAWLSGTWESRHEDPAMQFLIRFGSDGKMAVTRKPGHDEATAFWMDPIPADGYSGHWMAQPAGFKRFDLTLIKDDGELRPLKLIQTGPDSAEIQTSQRHFPMRRLP